MKQNDRLYAMPTKRCNLTCEHCDIKEEQETYDREKFLEVLNSFENAEILLFGGEVTTNIDRMFDIIQDNKMHGKSKIQTISTNLIILNDRLLEYYKELDGISTSWNPGRFNDNQYTVWKRNCQTLSDNKIPYRIMITLTEDLFQISAREFLDNASSWITDTLFELKFEHYVGDVTKEYFNRADQWLCELYKEWDLPVDFEIINRIGCWHFNCDDVYTLYPDGSLMHGCPHKKSATIATECYSCDRVSTCRPCRLQPFCQYPHGLAKLVNFKSESEVE